MGQGVLQRNINHLGEKRQMQLSCNNETWFRVLVAVPDATELQVRVCAYTHKSKSMTHLR
jgi:hypothetical protein